MGIAVLTISPSLVLALVIEYYTKEYVGPVESMFLETMIPSLAAAIILFFFNDWLNVKLGLIEMIPVTSESNDLLTHNTEDSKLNASSVSFNDFDD